MVPNHALPSRGVLGGKTMVLCADGAFAADHAGTVLYTYVCIYVCTCISIRVPLLPITLAQFCMCVCVCVCMCVCVTMVLCADGVFAADHAGTVLY
jgi:hypothetical protein